MSIKTPNTMFARYTIKYLHKYYKEFRKSERERLQEERYGTKCMGNNAEKFL